MKARRRIEPLGAATLTPQVRSREFRRVLRRLAEPGAQLVPGGVLQGFDLKLRKNRYGKPVMSIAETLGRALIGEGLVRPLPGAAAGYEIAPEGFAYLQRAEADAAPFAAQHRLFGQRYVSEGSGQGAMRAVNLAESPLTWLASRKGPDGAPLLAAPHVEAGERLREDFTRAQLMQRVTVDWQRPIVSGGQAGDHGLSVSEAAVAARQRLRAAFAAVGTEFEELLLSVCCQLSGLAEVERRLGWPPRAGKIVLRIALDRLARHYGIIREETRPGLRAWAP